MSAAILCHFCQLRQIRANALAAGLAVTVRPHPGRPGYGGKVFKLYAQDVYVHPMGVEPTQEHWVCGAVRIPDGCVCQGAGAVPPIVEVTK